MQVIEDRVECRTPTSNRTGTTAVPAWKYRLIRRAIRDAIARRGASGMPFAELPNAVRRRLSERDRELLGSVNWHTTIVKLNMEVEGELARLPGSNPQKLVLGN